MVWFTSFNFFFVCVAFVLLCFLLCWSFLIPLLFGLSGVFSFVSCWLSATPWVAAPVWNRSSTCGHLSWGYLVSASSVAEELHHMLVTWLHVLVLVCLFVFLAEELFSLIVFSSLLLSSWVLVLLLCCYFFVVYLFSAFGSKRMGSQTMTWEECGPWNKVTK